MANVASQLLAAYNGKAVTPGSTVSPNATANPFSQTPDATQQVAQPAMPDPGASLQSKLNDNQNAYKAQYTDARNQVLNNVSSMSVGGQNAAQANQNPVNSVNPTADQFSSALSAVNQRGTNATQQQQLTSQNTWNQKLSDLASQFNTNRAQVYANANGALTADMPTGATGDNPGAKAVALAQQVVKSSVPYVWGGNSLTQGVDCSGLVQQVYGKLGIHLPRTSSEQAKFGKVVPSLAQAMPGDLILEYSPYEPSGLQQYGHVGIYLGNGQVIEAPGTGKNVRIGPIVNMTRIVRPW